MKKLIKPVMSMEDYTEEVVQAFCEFDFWSCVHCALYFCGSMNKVELDEDILF